MMPGAAPQREPLVIGREQQLFCNSLAETVGFGSEM